jgi:hypothetical protein
MRLQHLPANVCNRLESILLAEVGCSAGRLAKHTGYGYRAALDVLDGGRDALVPRHRRPARDRARRVHIAESLCELLQQGPTRNSPQFAQAPRNRGVDLSLCQVHSYLRTMRSGYRRTAGIVEQKQDPGKAARAEAVFANLTAQAETGRLGLVYLDEYGFAPSPETSYNGYLPGQRKRMPDEHPQGHRVKVLATLQTDRRIAAAGDRGLRANGDILRPARVAHGLPTAGVPLVVLDNAGLHNSKTVRTHTQAPLRWGTFPHYQPAHCLALNRIEPVLKQLKLQDILCLSDKSKNDRPSSVESRFESCSRNAGPRIEKNSGRLLNRSIGQGTHK